MTSYLGLHRQNCLLSKPKATAGESNGKHDIGRHEASRTAETGEQTNASRDSERKAATDTEVERRGCANRDSISERQLQKEHRGVTEPVRQCNWLRRLAAKSSKTRPPAS